MVDAGEMMRHDSGGYSEGGGGQGWSGILRAHYGRASMRGARFFRCMEEKTRRRRQY